MKTVIYIFCLIELFAHTTLVAQDIKLKQKATAEKNIESHAKTTRQKKHQWKMDGAYFIVNSNKELIELSVENPDITHLKFYPTDRYVDTLPLPSEIGNFKELTHLILYSFNTDELPSSIENLQKLKYINIGVPTLINIPEHIGKLKSLEELIISFADGTKTISSKIFKLPILRKLLLARVHSSVVLEDDAFEELENLEELIIEDTSIKIPKSVNKLKNLKLLDLGVYYGDVPPEIYELDKIETLKLHSISKEESIGIGNLKAVKNLHLESCEFVSVEIAQMKDIEELTLWNVSTEELPDELTALTKIKKLKLIGLYKIKELPKFINNLNLLEELIVYGCDSLLRIDDEIFNLPNLKTIYHTNNSSLLFTENQKTNSKLKKYR